MRRGGGARALPPSLGVGGGDARGLDLPKHTYMEHRPHEGYAALPRRVKPRPKPPAAPDPFALTPSPAPGPPRCEPSPPPSFTLERGGRLHGALGGAAQAELRVRPRGQHLPRVSRWRTDWMTD
jgi:hypothetical protein